MADLEDLLVHTSRTFALAIPRLPEPMRREVTIAYLLFRIIDTVEDASHWEKGKRTSALAGFGRLLEDDDPSREEAERLAASWGREGLSRHPGYAKLVAELPAVLDAARGLPAAAAGLIRRHVGRSAEGMAGFVARTDERGVLHLKSRDDLRAYCYTVAGIVGEMLTELFLADGRLLGIAGTLRPRAADFGEGLQLVNILKDARADASEGRRYLPDGVALSDVFALARRDLESASEYVVALERAGADSGVVGFTALPVRLAWATLDRVERDGPGAKMSRLEVARITASLDRALLLGRPALPSPPVVSERSRARG